MSRELGGKREKGGRKQSFVQRIRVGTVKGRDHMGGGGGGGWGGGEDQNGQDRQESLPVSSHTAVEEEGGQWEEGPSRAINFISVIKFMKICEQKCAITDTRVGSCDEFGVESKTIYCLLRQTEHGVHWLQLCVA